MHYIYTMAYYLALKNNDILKFVGRWIPSFPLLSSGVTPPLADCDSTYTTFIMSCGSVGPKLVRRVSLLHHRRQHSCFNYIWQWAWFGSRYRAIYYTLSLLAFAYSICYTSVWRVVFMNAMWKEGKCRKRICVAEYMKNGQKRGQTACLQLEFLTGHPLTDAVKNKGNAPTSDLSDLLFLHCSCEGLENLWRVWNKMIVMKLQVRIAVYKPYSCIKRQWKAKVQECVYILLSPFVMDIITERLRMSNSYS